MARPASTIARVLRVERTFAVAGLMACVLAFALVAAAPSGAHPAAEGPGRVTPVPPQVQEVLSAPVQPAAEPPLAATPPAPCGPGSRPETGLQGRVSRAEPESGRAAEGYTCNTETVGHFGDEKRHRFDPPEASQHETLPPAAMLGRRLVEKDPEEQILVPPKEGLATTAVHLVVVPVKDTARELRLGFATLEVLDAPDRDQRPLCYCSVARWHHGP